MKINKEIIFNHVTKATRITETLGAIYFIALFCLFIDYFIIYLLIKSILGDSTLLFAFEMSEIYRMTKIVTCVEPSQMDNTKHRRWKLQWGQQKLRCLARPVAMTNLVRELPAGKQITIMTWYLIPAHTNLCGCLIVRKWVSREKSNLPVPQKVESTCNKYWN